MLPLDWLEVLCVETVHLEGEIVFIIHLQISSEKVIFAEKSRNAVKSWYLIVGERRHSYNGAHTQNEHTKLAHILPEEIFSFLFILYIISVKISRTEVLERKRANSFLTWCSTKLSSKMSKFFLKELSIYLGEINNVIIFSKGIVKCILFIKIERSRSKISSIV